VVRIHVTSGDRDGRFPLSLTSFTYFIDKPPLLTSSPSILKIHVLGPTCIDSRAGHEGIRF